MEYNKRGYTKDTSGDYRGALLVYTKAIEIDPNDADSYYNRGNAKNNLEDYIGPVLIHYRACTNIFKPSHTFLYILAIFLLIITDYHFELGIKNIKIQRLDRINP